MIKSGIESARSEGREIDDRTARIIASAWHSGQSSPLYSLASTGAINADTSAEIADNMSNVDETKEDDLSELGMLSSYVEHHGIRGRQNGWSDLHW